MTELSESTVPVSVVLKTIPVCPNDDYRAGDDGQIYSRTKSAGPGWKEYGDWHPLKGCRSSKGYQIVSLCHNNKRITKSIHRMICLAFHGPPPSPTSQVRHLDGNKDNNYPTNLKWGTQLENCQDKREHGTMPLGEAHHASKLTDLEREHLRWCLKAGLTSQRSAARILGMSQSAIWEIAHASL